MIRSMNGLKVYYVYIIECENGSYYTGITTDPVRRYRGHLDGTGRAKYTRAFRPVRLARCWELTCTRGDALRVEQRIKRKSRRDKELLVARPRNLARELPPGVESAGLSAARTRKIEREARSSLILKKAAAT